MSDNRNSLQTPGGNRETVCIDTMHVLDSCKDKDCLEDIRVYLSSVGQEIINNSVSIRAKSAEVLWAYLAVNPIPFNEGFYQINIRYYICVNCESCIATSRAQDFIGLAVADKTVVLYGAKGNVNIFKSDPENTSSCPGFDPDLASTNLPTAVCDVASPIVLSSRICQINNFNRCSIGDFPQSVNDYFQNSLIDVEEGNVLLVTLGLFSIIRIERPCQYLVNASDYTVPDKTCHFTKEDPCSLFKHMDFPVDEFSPKSLNYEQTPPSSGICGCHKN